VANLREEARMEVTSTTSAPQVNVRPRKNAGPIGKKSAIDRAKGVEKHCLRRCGKNARNWSENISFMVWTA